MPMMNLQPNYFHSGPPQSQQEQQQQQQHYQQHQGAFGAPAVRVAPSVPAIRVAPPPPPGQKSFFTKLQGGLVGGTKRAKAITHLHLY